MSGQAQDPDPDHRADADADADAALSPVDRWSAAHGVEAPRDDCLPRRAVVLRGFASPRAWGTGVDALQRRGAADAWLCTGHRARSSSRSERSRRCVTTLLRGSMLSGPSGAEMRRRESPALTQPGIPGHAAAMAEFPQRVRTHRLESEARRHFRELVENHGWVVRPLDQPDYGIDDHVEIFDGDDATGLTFLVQSRGTDTTLDAALKVETRTAQQNYFRVLSDPVLIARYHSPTRKTLAKWFHAVDPYPRRSSQTITLSLTDELSPSGIEALASEVRRFRSFRSPTLQWPVRVLVRSDGPDNRELELAISSILQQTAETLRVADTDVSGHAVLEARIHSDQVVVHAGLASHTVHGSIAEAFARSVASAVVFSAALVLDGLGHASQAADVFEARLIDRGVAADALSDIGGRLGRARRMDAVFRIVEHYRAQHEERHLAATLVMLTSSTAVLPRETSDRRKAAKLLEDVAVEAVDTFSLPEVRASALLCAARIRFAAGDWAEANRDYLAATEAGARAESKQGLLPQHPVMMPLVAVTSRLMPDDVGRARSDRQAGGPPTVTMTVRLFESGLFHVVIDAATTATGAPPAAAPRGDHQPLDDQNITQVVLVHVLMVLPTPRLDSVWAQQPAMA